MTTEPIRPQAFDHPVVPLLTIDGAKDAIAFYAEAFGATELGCLDGEDGRVVNACVQIAGAPVMLMDVFRERGELSPAELGGTPVSLHLAVPDVDASFARAVAAGATAVMEPQDMFWGDRFAALVDPFGHRWSMGTPIRDVSPEEMREAARATSAPAA